MRRFKTTRPRPAVDLERALRGEQQRSTRESGIQFHEANAAEVRTQQHQILPRTLENGTFFTPHLLPHHKRFREPPVKSEWAVLMPGLRPVVVRQLWNPVRHPMAALPTGISTPVKTKVHNLEKEGWQFVGTNGDILVFERQFNYLQDGTRQAKRGALVLAVAVTSLTALLYCGEYIYRIYI